MPRESKKSISQSVILNLVLVGATLATLVISPLNYDPIGIPKLTVFAFLVSIALLAFVFFSKPDLQFNRFNSFLLLMILLMILNPLINSYAFSERLIGISTRNTGAIANVFFALAAFIIANTIRTQRPLSIVMFLYICHLVVAFYYLAQVNGFDLIEFQEFYGKPSSTLGNPTFVSGFLGFTALLPIVWLKSKNFLSWILFLFATTFSLFIIFDTQSITGIFSFAGAAVTLIGFWIKRRFAKTLKPFFFFILLFGLTAVLGLAGRGPLSAALATSTLFSRVDYWSTAIKMGFGNPVFGVGFDGYGDFYRKYRTDAATNRIGFDQFSDTPHNLFLDYLASGGIPLLMLVVTLTFIAYFQSFKLIYFEKDIELNFVLLFAAWNGCILQAMITPSNFGETVWFWIMLGSLYGISQVDAQRAEQVKNLGVISSQKSIQVGNANLISGLLTRFIVVLSVFVANVWVVNSFQRDREFLYAANRSDGNLLVNIAQEWPKDTRRIWLVSLALKGGEYKELSLDIAKFGIEHNPNSYNLWKEIYDSELATPSEKLKALQEISRLEPRFDSAPGR